MNLLSSIQTARGLIPFDLAVVGARLVNVLTGEIYPADVGVCQDRISYVGRAGAMDIQAGEIIQANGRFLSPGLIDTHVHIESSMLTPSHFAQAVLPRGTTTVVIDPHEIANVLGMNGVRYMLDASAGLPLKIYVLAPSCVPAVPGLETAGAVFGPAEIAELLSQPRVIGLAEVMDYPGVIEGSPRMMGILQAAASRHALICGHCPALQGPDLQAYLAAGPDSDHEVQDANEMLEKLRSGMTIEAHESFHSQNVDTLVQVLKGLPLLPPNVTFCIDDLPADSLLRDGHIDQVLRQAVRSGLPAVTALRIATTQAAARCRLYDLGTIAAGKIADLVLLDDLVDFHPSTVVCSGQVVVRDSQLIAPFSDRHDPTQYAHTVTIPDPPSAETFHIPHDGSKALVRIIRLIEPTWLTEFTLRELPAAGGCLDWQTDPDLCLVGVFERHGRSGHHSLGLLEGFGMTAGAIGSTLAHDSHNLIVVGRSPADMAVAVKVLVATGGGMVCLHDGQVTGLVELPIAGLLSPKRAAQVAADLSALRRAVIELGVRGKDPLLAITELALPVIPQARFSDLGLVDVLAQKHIPFWGDA